MWQDWVIAGVQYGFIVALLPSMWHREHKPEFRSSLLTAILMGILALTMTTLSLWVASAFTFINGLQWAVLAYQRWRLDNT